MNPIIEYSCCTGSQLIGKTEDNWQLCRTTIVTFSDNKILLGFTNTFHIDKTDRYKKHIQDDLCRYRDNLHDKNAKNVLSSSLKVGIGKPTTCTYQFMNYLHNDNKEEIFQFFLYDGLNIALRIRDFACKTFYGHLASHRTAMPIIVRNNKVYYNDDNIGVFAWGKS